MILFAAIAIPRGLSRDLERIQKGVSGARWRDPDSFHITLAYFGEVDDNRAEELDRRLADRAFPSFDLTLKGFGHFGKAQPHQLWAGVEDPTHLAGLNAHCRSAARGAGIAMERRVFRPHLTLAYLAETVDIERLIKFEQRQAKLISKPFLVDEFQLWSSHRRKTGPNVYRMEATYPLLG